MAQNKIEEIENIENPSQFEQEIYSICTVFLIENAPLESFYTDNSFIKNDKFKSMKNTVVDWAYRIKLADMVMSGLNFIELIALLKKMPDLQLSQSLAHETARYLILLGEQKNALELIQFGLNIEVAPNKESCLMNYLAGSIFKNLNKFDLASDHFKKVICHGNHFIHKSQVAGAYFHLAVINQKKDNLITAKKYFKLALSYNPTHNAAKQELEKISVPLA